MMRRRSEGCPRREGGGRSSDEVRRVELSQIELQMSGCLAMAPREFCFPLVCESFQRGLRMRSEPE